MSAASSWRTRLMWGLCAALLAVLMVKFFLADVYRVESGSMRPKPTRF